MSPGRAQFQRSRRWGSLALATRAGRRRPSPAPPTPAPAATITTTDTTRRHVVAYNPPYASIVVDANSGKVLQATNADSPRHPASLTKMMTLYLLFERLAAGKMKMSTEMPVSAHAAAMAPTKLGLKPGETLCGERRHPEHRHQVGQ